jgi:Tol biopolymer transport system component
MRSMKTTRGRAFRHGGGAHQVWAGLVGLMLSALLTVPTPALATFPGGNGRLAVHGCRQQFCSLEHDIFSVSEDGQTVRRIVRSRNREEFAPAWSPNGKWLLFTASTRSGSDLFRVRADGSDQRRITRRPSVFKANPDWSPDGSRVIYEVRRRQNSNFRIKNLRTGEVRRLDPPGRRAFNPAWSPTGRRIAFVQGRGGDDTNLEIFTIRPDGSGIRRLTRNNITEHHPDWSPDGRRIAFVRATRDLTLADDLWTMRANGTRKRRVWFDPDGLIKVWSAVWSPDGSWIAFIADGTDGGAGEPEIFRIRSRPGSQPVQLTNDDYDFRNVDWRPV